MSREGGPPRKIQKCSRTEFITAKKPNDTDNPWTIETCPNEADYEVPIKIPKSLLVLNEHCLEHIVQYVPTIEQYHLMKSHSMLHRVVNYTWKLQLREVDYDQQHFTDFTEAQFLDFMQAISPYVEKMTLNYLPRRLFTLLGQCRFVRVHTFKCKDPYMLSHRRSDFYDRAAMTALKVSFPNIVELKAEGFDIVQGCNFFNSLRMHRLNVHFA